MTDFNTNNPFKIPDNYFEELENTLLNTPKTSSKNPGFKTPIGYFKTLENVLVEKNTKPSLNVPRKLILAFTSIAAIMLLMLTLTPEENLQPTIEEQALNDFVENYYLENMDSYEILSMIEDNEIETDFENLLTKP
jgi:hypothetical protein